MKATCQVEGCSRPARAKGLCAMHGMRLRRRGDVNAKKASGRPPNEARANHRRMLVELGFMSERTFSRWHSALETIRAIEGHDAMEAAILSATRPNGSVNVAKAVRIAELAVFRAMLKAEKPPKRKK